MEVGDIRKRSNLREERPQKVVLLQIANATIVPVSFSFLAVATDTV